MSRFFETIRCENGQYGLLKYHQERLNQTRYEVFGLKNAIDLEEELSPFQAENALFRCRVNYAENIQKIEFFPYKPARHKTVKLLNCGSYHYPYKSEDRDFLNAAVVNSGCDDVLFLKDNFLTDSSYANICLFQNGKWFTPKSYLLKGVKRQFLIDCKKIEEVEITKEDLSKFSKIAFINAMRDFEMTYEFEQIGDILHLLPAEENQK